MNNETDLPSGIYIHVPFCLNKCRYCNFFSVTKLDLLDEYASAVCQETTMASQEFPPPDTLYFGGGTPSLLPQHLLARILGKIDMIWGLAKCTEITLECNPATVDFEQLRHLKELGVNRLNIGIQSFNTDNLKLLGRIHTSSQAVSIVNSARRAGFTDIGIDMIYGLPRQRITQWENDLKTAVDLDPEHISCYILTYEPGTPLQRALTTGRFSGLDDAIIADMFRLTHTLLASSGFDHYEISNFSKKGFRSTHNEKYWNFNSYLGFGPAAHSYLSRSHERWWNHDSIERYLTCIQEGKHPICAQENLNSEQRIIEAVFLGLRQAKGLDFQMLSDQFDMEMVNKLKTAIHPWMKSGHAVVTDRSCYLAVEGMLVSDRIVGDIIAHI